MALGVLNNLSAIYAENNLNNTSNSLQKVLQQLSSGSKINSGADDSAGLSLVNGLQANSTALAQSGTNAKEGVGLLQVADGALSQVTNLLDRAITLATEASNGTLNTSQEAAANQEYTSIMSEINNIGSTTTYNQQQVFSGIKTAIYTGDSSTTGSSIDELNIHTLSQSSVGDTGGAMSYSNGQNNVFINLSSGTKNASAGDSLNASGATTITVNYLAKGAGGVANAATANISVGSGTSYANTAQGMINAINASGLGLSATFSTAAEAGTVAVSAALAANTSGGSANNTGIEISGTAVGTGTIGAGNIGTLTVSNTTDVLAGSLTIVGSDGKSHAITLGTANSTDTLAHLMATINSAGLGVVASSNAGIVNGHAPGTVMTMTASSAAITVVGTNITDTAGTTAAATLSPALPTLAAASPAGTLGTVTVDNKVDTLSGSLSIAGTDGVAHAVTLGTANSTDTLANLANFINTNVAFAASNLSASVDSTGTILTISTTAAVAAGKTASITPTALAAVHTSPSIYVNATPAQSGSFTASIGTLTASALTASYSGGKLNLGPNASIALGTAGSTDTLANIMTTVNNGNYGVTASLNTTAVGNNAIGTILTFTSANSADTFSVSGAVGFSSGSVAATVGVQNPNQIGTVTLPAGTSSTIMAANDVFRFNGGAISYTTTGGQTMDQVAAAITALNDGITATVSNLSPTGAVMTFVSTSTSTQGVNVSFTAAAADVGANYSATTDTPSTTSSGFYSVGISGTITDASTGGGTANTGIVSDTNGMGGIATTSYTDGAGANLSNTDLLSQSDAQAALTALAQAITDVSSMDGYIGAQINTLNSVSQVMTTQQENVTSAQNAIQATDYASATAAMSKYEILSQTGIAALAQANTVQQEVTKLLQ